MFAGKRRQMVGRDAVLLWGSAEEVDGQIELTAPRGAADGIGSALLLVKWKPMHGARAHAEVMERWAGTEAWRGPWLYITGDPKFFYPAFYVRPYAPVRIERGWSTGIRPRDQLILDTTRAPGVAGEMAWTLWLSCDWEAFSISTAADWWSSITRKAINAPTGSEMAWPPMWLGLYCEASRTRWVLEDLEP